MDTMIEKQTPEERAARDECTALCFRSRDDVHFVSCARDDENEEDEEEAHVIHMLEDDKSFETPDGSETLFFSETRDATRKNIQDDRDRPERKDSRRDMIIGGCHVPHHVWSVLKEHQRDALRVVIRGLQNGHGSLLAHGMGMGKTLTTLVALSVYMASVKWVNCIIVCPRTLIIQWESEIEKFDHLLNLNVLTVLSKSDLRSNMTRRATKGGCVTIIGVDMFRVCKDTIPMDEHTIIVVDEAHLHLSNQTQIFHAINQSVTRLRILLSGTPVNNGAKEYFNMMSVLSTGTTSNIIKELQKDYGSLMERAASVDATERDVNESRVAHRVLTGVMKNLKLAHYASRDEILKAELPPKREFVLMHKHSVAKDSSNLNPLMQRNIVHDDSREEKISLVNSIIDSVHSEDCENVIVFSDRIETLDALSASRPQTRDIF